MTVRTRSALQALFADNTSGDISAADLRDLLDSALVLSQGSGVPGSTPSSLFEMYVDTTNHDVYVAINTSAATDWVKLNANWRSIGSWTYSSNVANVDFTNIIYKELLLIMRGITRASSSVTAIRVSVDNGSNFYSTNGDYKSISTAGIESDATGPDGLSVASTGARSGTFWLPTAGLSTGPKPIWVNRTMMPTLFTASSSPINAIRALNSSAVDFSGGSMLLLGR